MWAKYKPLFLSRHVPPPVRYDLFRKKNGRGKRAVRCGVLGAVCVPARSSGTDGVEILAVYVRRPQGPDGGLHPLPQPPPPSGRQWRERPGVPRCRILSSSRRPSARHYPARYAGFPVWDPLDLSSRDDSLEPYVGRASCTGDCGLRLRGSGTEGSRATATGFRDVQFRTESHRAPSRRFNRAAPCPPSASHLSTRLGTPSDSNMSRHAY